MFGKHCMAVFVRLFVASLLLISVTTLYARGRVRGYQAGGGTHRTVPKPAKAPRDKPKKPVPPPDAKSDPHVALR
jgi:hypothetical protein